MKKTFKKLMAALLAVALLCAMAVPAFAAEGAETGSGTITIEKAINGETYTAYKIFDVVSFKEEADGSKTYVYMIADEWSSFFEQSNVKDYVTVDKIISLHGSRARSLMPTCRLLQSLLWIMLPRKASPARPQLLLVIRLLSVA